MLRVGKNERKKEADEQNDEIYIYIIERIDMGKDNNNISIAVPSTFPLHLAVCPTLLLNIC